MPEHREKESCHQNLTKCAAGMLVSYSTLQDCEKISFCCLNHLVCGNLLWKPKKTNTNLGARKWGADATNTSTCVSGLEGGKILRCMLEKAKIAVKYLLKAVGVRAQKEKKIAKENYLSFQRIHKSS